MNELLLPPGTRLLHIGPHKTGTTALQVALAKARDDLESQGVRYLWGGVRQTNANLAAQALAGKPSRKFSDESPVPLWHWENLLEKVRKSEDFRIMVSGEEFCNINDAAISNAIKAFGRNRTKILVTLRPLEKILSSQWQQYIQFGAVTERFEPWLTQAFASTVTDRLIQEFWVRHRHDDLIDRWGKAVGMENVYCLVLDPLDHGLLFRSVEALFGLRESTLVDDGRLLNRSITAPEAEAIRSMYVRLRDLGLGELSRHVRYMISPSELIKRDRVPVEEPKIELPRWALTRAREISSEMAQNIARSGAQIIGNIHDLTPTDSTVAPDHLPTLETLPADLPGWTAAGVIISSGISRGDLPPTPTTSLPTVWLRRATGAQLMREVMRRVKIRLARPLSRLTGRVDEKAER
jgi:hypothetical protein